MGGLIMKILSKADTNIYIAPGDTIQLLYDGVDGDGRIRREVVLEKVLDKEYHITEGVIFEVEKGEFGKNVTGGIGGAFLETKEKKCTKSKS
jgi:hypothetical protein